MAYDNGASYIISPNTDTAVIKKTKELGLVSIPGAFTPTEISTAFNAGADVVKLFPAGLLGVDYIHAVHAPLSHIPIAAVEGIYDSNIAAFFQAGVFCVGIGGNLVSQTAVLASDYDSITRAAGRLIDALSF